MADDLRWRGHGDLEVVREDEKQQPAQTKLSPEEEDATDDPDELEALLVAAAPEKINRSNAAAAAPEVVVATTTRSSCGGNCCCAPRIVGGLVGLVVVVRLAALSASSLSSPPYGGAGRHHPSADLFVLSPPIDDDNHLNSSSFVATVEEEEDVYREQQFKNPPGTCILDPSQLPREWMPPSHLSFQDSGEAPWTQEEQQLADDASQKGLDELVDFYDSVSEQRIVALSTDAANSLIDQCFASANRPDFRDKACRSASRVLKIIAPQYFTNDSECNKMKRKSKLLAYVHYLSVALPGDLELKETRSKLVEVVRTSFDKCRNLDEYLHVSRQSWETNLDLNKNNNLSSSSLPRKTLKNYIHQQGLINLYTIPEFRVPEEVDRFIARIWKFVAQYNFVHGVDVKQGYADADTRHHGYLVTHVAYWPTGYGRHVQLVEDAPWLYEYIRKNYWTAMETGGLDLFAEFLDILRQCGCTEDNDLMVRHGARYFLKVFKDLGSTWMPAKSDSRSDYSRIHLPWTAIGGLRRKEMEPLVPGSMGYGFKKALERGQEADNLQVP